LFYGQSNARKADGGALLLANAVPDAKAKGEHESTAFVGSLRSGPTADGAWPDAPALNRGALPKWVPRPPATCLWKRSHAFKNFSTTCWTKYQKIRWAKLTISLVSFNGCGKSCEYSELSQMVMQLTKTISESVEKVRAFAVSTAH
jgi:hypothetical protein